MSSNNTTCSVFNLFQDIIPASTLGLSIEKYDANACELIVSAPLDLNRNDKGTAFAGSIYSTLVLSGWALVTQLLRDHDIDAQVVVANSSTQYIAPVSSSTFQSYARIKQSGDNNLDQLVQSMQTKGKGKIEIISVLLSSGDDTNAKKVRCATFTALYAASLRPSSTSSSL